MSLFSLFIIIFVVIVVDIFSTNIDPALQKLLYVEEPEEDVKEQDTATSNDSSIKQSPTDSEVQINEDAASEAEKYLEEIYKEG